MEGFQAKLWGYKLSARISVLLPFQAMVLFGLAGLPSLPLPVFSYAFSKLDFLENYSYAVYVFQFLCYAVWPQTGLVNLLWFLVFTYASAFLIAKLIQQPIQKWWAAHTRALGGALRIGGCLCGVQLSAGSGLSSSPSRATSRGEDR